MVNKLATANSPYLLQHMNNPVDWFPWGEAALEKARLEQKPIFLSIGYAACHWCHVMAHESFEDQAIAEIMNNYFVNIKVDREERPDLDNIYMNAVVAMTGHGGWPMSVFLTPEGNPFYGGTYFPPVSRHGLPAFREVLLSVAKVWVEDRERILSSGDQITQHIRNSISINTIETEPLDKTILEQGSLTLAQSYDWKHGGWGKAPKFPQPIAIEFLLRRAISGDKLALEIAVHALDAMAKGGMYDVVGGGFSRYSTDDTWLVPHFEKMLYDNALLASAYLHAYLLTGKEKFRKICESTLDFVLREMTDPSGAFYSSLDADSEGEEGKFYLWTDEEIRKILVVPEDIDLFIKAYGVTPNGNFDGKTVLQRALENDILADMFNLDQSDVSNKLSDHLSLLLSERNKRVRPGTDDKALTSWNALMLVSFSEAARYLNREDYRLVAIRNGSFLINNLLQKGQLYRSYRARKVTQQAFLEDYASLCLGLISLYQTDSDPVWFRFALKLAEDMVGHFSDPSGGFFDTPDNQNDLITRPKDIQDNAIPSGNAMASTALLYLSALQGESKWRDLAEPMLHQVQGLAKKFPLAFGQWLCAMDLLVSPGFEVAILGNLNLEEAVILHQAVWSRYRPNLVSAFADFPPPDGSPKLLKDRSLKDNRPTAYVCQSFFCNQPVNTATELLEQLDNPIDNRW